MACNITISGRAFPCKDGIGGIKKIWVAEYGNVDWGDIANGAVSTTGNASAPALYEFDINRNAGSFEQAITSSVENGTVYYSQVLTVTMPKLVAADTAEIADLLNSRLTILVQDNNDNYLIMGYSSGAESQGGGIGTGTAKGDLNGYNLEFIAEEAQPAPHLTDLTQVVLTAAS